MAGVTVKTGFFRVPLSKLVKAEWNYKVNNPDLAAKLRENIRKNGQIENIIVREVEGGLLEVVNGNHRLDVLRELGETDAMAYNLGPITLQAAQRIAIETNETSFLPDSLKLAHLLTELTKSTSVEDLALTMPYSKMELENFASLYDLPFSSDLPADGSFEISPETRALDEAYTREIKLVVTAEVYQLWLKWKALQLTQGKNAGDSDLLGQLLVPMEEALAEIAIPEDAELALKAIPKPSEEEVPQ